MIGVSDRYVIGYFLDARQVGIYSAAYGLGSIIYLFYAPLNSVLLPAITNQYENNKIEEVKTIVRYTLKFFLALSVPATFGLLVLSKSLLNVTTTDEFTSAHTIVPLVAFGTIFFSVSYIFADLLLLFKKTKLISAIFSGSALLNLVLNIILVNWIGIFGAAISTMITFIIHSIVLGIFSNKLIPFDIDLKFLAKCLASSIVMSLVVWMLGPTNVLTIAGSLILGAVVYFLCLLLVKGFNKNEIDFLKNLLKRRSLSL
jgi:O-antigen/teichoic acid export membrane protein